MTVDEILNTAREKTQLAEPDSRSWREGLEILPRTGTILHPQGRFGAHRYSRAQWGLSKADLEPYFADYLRTHPVPIHVDPA